jgi:hypothetical protein
MNLSDLPQTEPLAPEKPPKPSGGCCSKIATFLGLEPRAVAWLSIGPVRFELGLALSRRSYRATEPT